MKVVEGMYTGLISSSPKRKTTDKIHAVKEGFNYITVCGVNFEKSEILGIAREGKQEEINCKRCLKKAEGFNK